jgi:hypothetical protein
MNTIPRQAYSKRSPSYSLNDFSQLWWLNAIKGPFSRMLDIWQMDSWHNIFWMAHMCIPQIWILPQDYCLRKHRLHMPPCHLPQLQPTLLPKTSNTFGKLQGCEQTCLTAGCTLATILRPPIALISCYCKWQTFNLHPEWSAASAMRKRPHWNSRENNGECLCSQITRAICLLEADFKWWNKLIFAKRMIQQVVHDGRIPQEVFAKKHSHCSHAVLTKQFFFDSSHTLHHPAGLGECNFGDCYDCATPPPPQASPFRAGVFQRAKLGSSCHQCRPCSMF